MQQTGGKLSNQKIEQIAAELLERARQRQKSLNQLLAKLPPTVANDDTDAQQAQRIRDALYKLGVSGLTLNYQHAFVPAVDMDRIRRVLQNSGYQTRRQALNQQLQGIVVAPAQTPPDQTTVRPESDMNWGVSALAAYNPAALSNPMEPEPEVAPRAQRMLPPQGLGFDTQPINTPVETGPLQAMLTGAAYVGYGAANYAANGLMTAAHAAAPAAAGAATGLLTAAQQVAATAQQAAVTALTPQAADALLEDEDEEFDSDVGVPGDDAPIVTTQQPANQLPAQIAAQTTPPNMASEEEIDDAFFDAETDEELPSESSFEPALQRSPSFEALEDAVREARLQDAVAPSGLSRDEINEIRQPTEQAPRTPPAQETPEQTRDKLYTALTNALRSQPAPDNDRTVAARGVGVATQTMPGGMQTQWGITAYPGTGQQYANISTQTYAQPEIPHSRYMPGHRRCRGRAPKDCTAPCVLAKNNVCREGTNMTRKRVDRARANWAKARHATVGITSHYE
jgi:hypothetical protein